MSYTPEQLLKLMTKYADSASQKDNLVAGDDAVKTAEKKKLDPKAKVRNRGTVCVPAEHAKDKQDHFPINDEGQARSALSRVEGLSSAPWYNGTVEGLKALVKKKVHAKFPGIGKDKKTSKKAELYISDSLLEKYGEESDDKLEANSPEYQEALEAAKTKQAPAPFVATPTGQAQAPVVKRPPAYAPPPDYKPEPAYAPPPDYKPEPAYAPPPDYNPNGVDFEIDDVKASSIDRLINKYSQAPDMSSMLGQLGNMVQQAPAAIGQLGQSAQIATQIANITGKLSTRPAEAIQPITALLQSVAKNPQSASQTANMLITALSTAWGPMSAQVGSNAPFLGQMQQLLTALMAQLTQLRIPGVNLNVLQQMQSQVANLHPVPTPATPSDELERKNNVRHHKFSQIDFLLNRYSQEAPPRQALTFQRGNENEEIVDPPKPQQEVIEFPANAPKPVKPAPAKPAPVPPKPTGYAKESIDPWTGKRWDPNMQPPNVKHTKSSDFFDRMITKYSEISPLVAGYQVSAIQSALQQRDPNIGGRLSQNNWGEKPVDGEWGSRTEDAFSTWSKQMNLPIGTKEQRDHAVKVLMGGGQSPAPSGQNPATPPGVTPPAPAPAPAPATPSVPSTPVVPPTTPPAPNSDTPSGTTPPLPPEEQKKQQQKQQHHRQHRQPGQVPPPPPNAPPGGVPYYYPPNQPPPPPYDAPQGQPQYGPGQPQGQPQGYPPGQPDLMYEQGPGGVVPGYAGGVYPAGFRGRRVQPGYGPGFGRGPGYARGPGRPGGGGRRR